MARKVLLAFKVEQLYRQIQEHLYGEHQVIRQTLRRLSLLRESAALGHWDSIGARGVIHEEGKLCQENLKEVVRDFKVSADEEHAQKG
jgi:hypothetical protein